LLAEADDAAIIKVTIASAKGGDLGAAALYFKHLRVRVRLNPTPFELTPPKTAQEAVQATAMLVAKVAAGELDIGAFEAIVSGLQAFSSALVVCELASSRAWAGRAER
jgi:hypothetical protein